MAYRRGSHLAGHVPTGRSNRVLPPRHADLPVLPRGSGRQGAPPEAAHRSPRRTAGVRRAVVRASVFTRDQVRRHDRLGRARAVALRGRADPVPGAPEPASQGLISQADAREFEVAISRSRSASGLAGRRRCSRALSSPTREIVMNPCVRWTRCIEPMIGDGRDQRRRHADEAAPWMPRRAAVALAETRSVMAGAFGPNGRDVVKFRVRARSCGRTRMHSRLRVSRMGARRWA